MFRVRISALLRWFRIADFLPSHLNPGGYLEILDSTAPMRSHDETLKGTSLEKWGTLLLEASQKLGTPLDSALTAKRTMEEIGFVDVVEVIYQWPINRWPADKRMKELGMNYRFFVLEPELTTWLR